MKRLIVGECQVDHLYQLSDPDAPSEVEFEASVVKALSCVFPGYRCIVFGGTFQYDLRKSRPDLALVAKDFSHWFVVEVELTSHSLEGHVLPQVQTFQYGKPLEDCPRVLSRELKIPYENARTMVDYVPYSVVVVANRRDQKWETALKALNIQLLTIGKFQSPIGVEAYEVDGVLEVFSEYLGYGQYSATDRSIRFHKSVKLPSGHIQILDQTGIPTTWIVTQDGEATWATKEFGWPVFENGTYIFLTKTVDGRISFKIPV